MKVIVKLFYAVTLCQLLHVRASLFTLSAVARAFLFTFFFGHCFWRARGAGRREELGSCSRKGQQRR
jgi:hypothetical protein